MQKFFVIEKTVVNGTILAVLVKEYTEPIRVLDDKGWPIDLDSTDQNFVLVLLVISYHTFELVSKERI